MRIHWITRGLIAGGVFLLFLTMACNFKKPEEVVRERATILMQAKIDGKWDLVYDLYDADYRKTITREDFSRRPRNMRHVAFAIESVEVLPSGKEAVVKAKEDVTFQTYKFSSPSKAQRWIRAEDGKWYMKVEDALNPFGQMFQKKTEKEPGTK